ncbi:MAG: hypothetical protein WC833_06380 [Bacteroidales bacterium]
MRNLFIACIILTFFSCSDKLYRIQKLKPAPGLYYGNSKYDYKVAVAREVKGNVPGYSIYDNAVKDNESGERVAMRQLNEVLVSAKSQNIAERNGNIRLDFIVTVPEILQSSSWQLDMLPVLSRGDDTIHLDRVLLTGAEFKKVQERGYKRFEKYLKTIIPEDADFLEVFTDLPNLRIFLERNLPESRVLYGIENDSLHTTFGVNEKRIVEHYIKRWLIERNNKKLEQRTRVFAKYVKNPYLSGSRLDSIIKTINGDFEYHYTQEIVTNEKSSRLYLCLHGCVRDPRGICIKLKPSDTIVYNVSSMIHFIDKAPRYRKKIIERRVSVTESANISFAPGKWQIMGSLANNEYELNHVGSSIKEIVANEEFDMDSIIITSSSSPEGQYQQNQKLSAKRAKSIVEYYGKYLTKCHTISIPEEWERLKEYIIKDSLIKKKDRILKCFSISDPDERESAIRNFPQDYEYMKDSLYPRLRRVNFTFHLHRKGMVKDTIQTTETDSLYMRAIDLLEQRQYRLALGILLAYNDFNTAIAHMSLGNNHSAKEILEKTENSARKIYLLAILSAREGDEAEAVRYFLQSKRMDQKMAYRGGLDPEINFLIRKYNLNKELFE